MISPPSVHPGILIVTARILATSSSVDYRGRRASTLLSAAPPSPAHAS